MPQFLVAPSEDFDGDNLTTLANASVQDESVEGIQNGRSYRAILLRTVSTVFTSLAAVAEKPFNTELPKILGNFRVGGQAVVGTGVWLHNPTKFAFQWLRNGSPVSLNSKEAAYEFVDADETAMMSVRVEATNDVGTSFVTTIAVGPIAPAIVVTPPHDNYYPNVAPVNVAAKTTSLQFPPENYAPGSSAIAGNKLAFNQPVSTTLNWTPASNQAQSWIIGMNLPLNKRGGNHATQILGNSGSRGGSFQIGMNTDGSCFYSCRNRSGQSVTVSSPIVDEDGCILVLRNTGDGNYQLGWVSFIDGTTHWGESKAITFAGYSGTLDNRFNIGRTGTTLDFAGEESTAGANHAPLFSGDLQFIYRFNNAPTDAQLTALALGGEAGSILDVAGVAYARDFSIEGAVKPAWATAYDTTQATEVVPGSTLRAGTDFRRKKTSGYVTIDPIREGFIFGIHAGKADREVEFSGRTDRAGNIEIRVFDFETGAVVRDWTAVGQATNGRWAGKVYLPKGKGWWGCEARSAVETSINSRRMVPFTVGYRFVLLGQSQVQGMQYGSDYSQAMIKPGLASFMTADYSDSVSSDYPFNVRLNRIGTASRPSGLISFMNQFRQFDAETPVMLIDEAVNGTSATHLLEDTIGSGMNNKRSWVPQTTHKYEVFGTDITAVIHQWGTADMNGDDYPLLVEALLLGTGAKATSRNFRSLFGPETKMVISPLNRHIYTGSGVAGYRRVNVVKMANAKGLVVGPPVIDMKTEQPYGPHASNAGELSYMGYSNLAARMGIAAARAVGADRSRNPYFSKNVIRDGNKLIVTPVLLNGGEVRSPAASALKGWMVGDGGVTPVWTGFTAALVNGKIVITKSSGVWAAGTVVEYSSNGGDRASGDEAGEIACINGNVYESWDKDIIDPLKRGMPICGSLDTDGKWIPTFREVSVLAGSETPEPEPEPVDPTPNPGTGEGDAFTVTTNGVTYTGYGALAYNLSDEGVLAIVPGSNGVTFESPSPARTVNSNGHVLNGSVVDARSTGTGAQGFDQRRGMNWAHSNFIKDAGPTYPLTLQVGQTLTSTVGMPDPLTTNGRDGVVKSWSQVRVVSKLPPEGATAPMAVPVNDSIDQSYRVYDFDAIVASLPNLDAAGTPDVNVDTIIRNLRKFNPAFAVTNKGADGYEQYMPNHFGDPSRTNVNYGEYVGYIVNNAIGLLVSNKITAAQKKEIVRGIVSFGRQMDGVVSNSDGAHYQFVLGPVVLSRFWAGIETTAAELVKLDHYTQQFYFHDADTIDQYYNSHTDNTKSMMTRLRTVASVNGNTVNVPFYNNIDGIRCRFRGLVMVRESDKKSAVVTVDGGNFTGNPFNYPVGIDKQPDVPFKAGDKVYFVPAHQFKIGDPDWGIRHTQASNRHWDNPAINAGYRDQARPMAVIFGLKAIGALPVGFKPLEATEAYIERIAAGPYPSATFSYPGTGAPIGSVYWINSMWSKHWATVKQTPQLPYWGGAAPTDPTDPTDPPTDPTGPNIRMNMVQMTPNEVYQRKSTTDGDGRGVGEMSLTIQPAITTDVWVRQRDAKNGSTILQAPWRVKTAHVPGSSPETIKVTGVKVQRDWVFLDVAPSANGPWELGTSPVAVGARTLVGGQSQMQNFVQMAWALNEADRTVTMASVGVTPPTRAAARIRNGQSGVGGLAWGPISDADDAVYDSAGAAEFLNAKIAEKDCVCAVFGVTLGGTSITSSAYSSNDGQTGSLVWMAKQSGGGFEEFIWNLGGTDAGNDMPGEVYGEWLNKVLDYVLAANNSGIKPKIAITTMSTKLTLTYEQVMPIRINSKRIAAERGAVYVEARDRDNSDGVHQSQAGNVILARHYVRAFNGKHNPVKMVSGVRSGNIVTITCDRAVKVVGSPTYKIRVTPAGTRATNYGVSSVVADGNKLVVTLNENPGGATAVDVYSYIHPDVNRIASADNIYELVSPDSYPNGNILEPTNPTPLTIAGGVEVIPTNTSKPTLVSNWVVGQSIVLGKGEWNDNPTIFRYILEKSLDGLTFTNVQTTGTPYVQKAADAGFRWRLGVYARNSAGESVIVYSDISNATRASNPTIADDFNGMASGASLTGRALPTGQTWAVPTGYGNFNAVTTTGRIRPGSNSLIVAGNIGPDLYIDTDQFSRTRISTGTIGIVFRMQADGSHYRARHELTGGSWKLNIVHVAADGTTITKLGGEAAFPDMPADNTPWRMTVEAVGNTFKLFVDGTLRVTSTDTRITTGGGVGLWGSVGTDVSRQQPDGFRAGSLPAGTMNAMMFEDGSNSSTEDGETFVTE